MLPAVRSLRWFIGAVLATSLGFAAACGSANQGTLTATGGEICSVDRKLCLEIPSQGIEASQTFRISSPSADRPGGELTEVWDIEALNVEEYRFRKPAIVRVKLDAVTQSGELRGDDQLLRVFIARDGVWEAMGDAFFDRVRNELRGTTLLLTTKSLKRAVSAVAVFRGDRLPDGGVPFEIDAGMMTGDSGMFFPPVPDAGRRDAGVDAGMPVVDAGNRDAGVDAGIPDAGQPVDSGIADAGMPPIDAGQPVDSGVPVDAGVDAGVPVDAGFPDAGEVDAGQPVDAGSPVDAGEPDAGAPDAGSGDDAGAADAGDAG